MTDYVHGYSEREAQRLRDQAGSVRDLLHWDTAYAPGSLVLEAGCGVGAQTVTLARNGGRASFVSIDLAHSSILQARAAADAEGLRNVTFCRADLLNAPFSAGTFDHVFICFLLEHLVDPLGALRAARELLKPGGSVTAIEGDHGSCYFHPETREAMRAWDCLIEVQRRMGGDSLIGRKLYPLLAAAGFRGVEVSPRMVYADVSRPEVMESFVERTIVPMVEGVRAQALELGLMTPAGWERGLEDLKAIARSPEGSFCYTFFKAVGVR